MPYNLFSRLPLRAVSSRFHARAALALAMIIVGSSLVTGKYVTQALPTQLALWLRFCIASAVMIPLLYVREGGLPRIGLREWGILFAQAGCGGFLFNSLLLEGMRHTDATTAAIITATGPACALLVSCILLGERLYTYKVAAVGFALLGISILHLHGTADAAASYSLQEELTGTVLILGAIMAESLFLLLGKCMRSPISPLATATMLCAFGAIQFFPQALPELLSGSMTTIDTIGWLVILWYALGITVGAYLLWFSGIRTLQGAEAGLYTGIMPISAMFLSAMLMHSPIHWQHFAGCAAVLMGIAASARADRVNAAQFSGQ